MRARIGSVYYNSLRGCYYKVLAYWRSNAKGEYIIIKISYSRAVGHPFSVQSDFFESLLPVPTRGNSLNRSKRKSCELDLDRSSEIRNERFFSFSRQYDESLFKEKKRPVSI